MTRRWIRMALDALPFWLWLLVWTSFAVASQRFRQPQRLEEIIYLTASPAVVAMGMTFVLLTAGIDLSVGALMLVVGAVAGKLLLAGYANWVALSAMLALGVVWGTANGLLIYRLRMMPFIVTLAMLFIGRGAGLWITKTQPMNLPDAFRRLATERLAYIPIPVWILVGCLVAAHLLLTRTPFGRQVYAMGHDLEMARKAGVPIGRNQVAVYALCSLCAALGGAIYLAQLSAVSPTLGQGRELDAIAAAVLGGVSLFGGRGGPAGAVMGAMLIQTIFHGLTTLDADPDLNIDVDPYFYSLITSGIIFTAVALGSLRKHWTDRAPPRTHFHATRFS